MVTSQSNLSKLLSLKGFLDLSALVGHHALPLDYLNQVERHLLPLASWIQAQKSNIPLVVGFNGAQGSGKSTMCAVMAVLLKDIYGLKVAVLSLDDLYLSKRQRKGLAETIHPLLLTRGVPGTHDVGLGEQVLSDLCAGQGEVSIPRFDKFLDEPKAKDHWDKAIAPVDIVLFEGWCLGCVAQEAEALVEPVNTLEENEDAQGIWRGFVNQQLQDAYRLLFKRLDKLVFLQAPSFEVVHTWRAKQEQQTFKAESGSGMDDVRLAHFIAHFKRLTTFQLMRLPDIADVVVRLDQRQNIEVVNYCEN